VRISGNTWPDAIVADVQMADEADITVIVRGQNVNAIRRNPPVF
jgi:hypothetical protein